MKQYAEYINIDSPWITSLPKQWKVIRLKNVSSYISRGQTPLYTEDTSCAKVVNQATFSRGYWNTKKIRYTSVSPVGNENVPRNGDVLLASTGRGVLGKSFYFDIAGKYIADSHVTIIRPKQIVNGRFLQYYLSVHYSTINGYLAQGSTNQTELQEHPLKNLSVPVPPRAEQDQIVRYLDWQVSKINRLIAAKRRQIGLLKEKERHQISDAVLHGINPYTAMKNSGIQWIGEIPEGWSVIRCKYVFSERDERSISGEEEHLSMSQKYGLVPDSALDEHRMLSESYAGGKVCYKSDLVLNRLKAHLGVFALAPKKGVISPDYTVLIPNTDRIIPEYAEAVLKSDMCCRELRIRVRGIIEGFWRLYTDDFNTIVVPLPPMDEQRTIINYLTERREMQKQVCAKLEGQILVLQELRTRLISDVVTGQIDVRDIEIPDFEYTPDVETDSSDDEDSSDDDTDMSEEA